MENKKININEIYDQLTIQGEGMRAGRLCTFVRTNFCNLRCIWKDKLGNEHRCDTPFTSHNPEKGRLMEVQDIIDIIWETFNENGAAAKDIIITGGEPYMQEGVIKLVDELKRQGFFITIETNGTIFRKTNADLISISPKLPSSTPTKDGYARNMHIQNRIYNQSIPKFQKHNELIQYKFVYSCKEDIEEIKKFCKEFKINNEDVWLMPEGADLETQLRNTEETMNQAIENGFNFTSRLHVLAYGSRRGV